jgi:hypothetical protein
MREPTVDFNQVKDKLSDRKLIDGGSLANLKILKKFTSQQMKPQQKSLAQRRKMTSVDEK